MSGKKGRSGRPPKQVTRLKVALIKSKIPEAEYAFAVLCAVMHDEGEATPLRMAAANSVLDRVLGKPTQAVAVFDWRSEARKQGLDPDVLFPQLVNVAKLELGHSLDEPAPLDVPLMDHASTDVFAND